MRPPPALERAVSRLQWEIGRSRWPTVRLGRHSNRDLTGTKSAETPQGGQLIRRGSKIHSELDHPLVIEFRGFHPAPANRIARIVVGIALAMRDLHSQGVFRHNLTPASVLPTSTGTI
jgi:hypothetical protein